jgi:hypothetical protein
LVTDKKFGADEEKMHDMNMLTANTKARVPTKKNIIGATTTYKQNKQNKNAAPKRVALHAASDAT